MNLYLRLIKLLLALPFVRPRGLLDESRIAFRVWPNDCDLNLHLNNGRYLTFMDLGRMHLLAQMRLLGPTLTRRWLPVLGAAEMNFVRPINPFQKFELVSRLLTWDDKYFYVEQRFEVRGRLCAIGMVKGLFVRGGARVSSAEVLATLGTGTPPPAMPEIVRRWNDLSTIKKQGAA